MECKKSSGNQLVSNSSGQKKNYTKDGAILITIQPVANAPLDVIYNDYIRSIQTRNTIMEIGEEVINGRIYKTYYKINSFGDLPVKSLEYLSIEGLRESVKNGGCGFCDACFTGEYPIEPPVDLDSRQLTLFEREIVI